jgi:hypothetical protein
MTDTKNLEQNLHTALPFLSGGIAQIAYVVEDLERTVQSYYELFGIGPWHFYTYGYPLVPVMKRYGKPADYAMRVALGNCSSMRIELIQNMYGDTVYREFIEKHGYGIQHLGVLVTDMEQALSQARQAGLTVTMEGAGFGLDGDGYYAYLDTEELLGTTFELIQRPARRHPPEKIYPSE